MPPTRVPDSPVHAHNPTGKIPTLVVDDNIAIGETRLICEYLDSLHDGRQFAPVERSLAERAFEGFAVGFTDGVAVWIREVRRPGDEQSPGIVLQETNRAVRCLTYLEQHPELLGDPENYAQCCLLVAVWRICLSVPWFEWRADYPHVAHWYDKATQVQAWLQTRPE